MHGSGIASSLVLSRYSGQRDTLVSPSPVRGVADGHGAVDQLVAFVGALDAGRWNMILEPPGMPILPDAICIIPIRGPETHVRNFANCFRLRLFRHSLDQAPVQRWQSSGVSRRTFSETSRSFRHALSSHDTFSDVLAMITQGIKRCVRQVVGRGCGSAERQ